MRCLGGEGVQRVILLAGEGDFDGGALLVSVSAIDSKVDFGCFFGLEGAGEGDDGASFISVLFCAGVSSR